MRENLINESTEFREWLRRNDRHLRQYAPDETARLAIVCGFAIETICPLVSDRVVHIQRLIAFWESPLAEKWLRLWEYENGRDR